MARIDHVGGSAPPAPDPSRRTSALLLFGVLIGAPAAAAAIITVGSAFESTALVALGVVLGLGGFLGGVVLLWVFIFLGDRALSDGYAAWLAGDLARAEALAVRTLRRVFRADYHTRSVHLLGLCAEARGDFAEAAALFSRAARAVPLLLVTPAKARVRALALAHAAFALAAIGRVDEAQRAYGDACDALVRSMQRPLGLRQLLDDSAFGAVSMARVLGGVEPGRDARAVLVMAQAMIAYRARELGQVGSLVATEQAAITRGLLPRERALVAELQAASQRALAGVRGAGAAVEAMEPQAEQWARAALAADTRRG